MDGRGNGGDGILTKAKGDRLFDRLLLSRKSMGTKNMDQSIADLIKETYQTFGPSVATTFAQSFGLKLGHTHPDAITAQQTIERLNDQPSNSQALTALLNDATVVIPNTRSSGQARTKGRSVD